jgi:hypothetical protein
MSKLLSFLNPSHVCDIEGTDIPAMPKSLMFLYIKLEQRLGIERMGYLTFIFIARIQGY